SLRRRARSRSPMACPARTRSDRAEPRICPPRAAREGRREVGGKPPFVRSPCRPTRPAAHHEVRQPPLTKGHQMNTTSSTQAAEAPIRNGVDTAALFATIGVVNAQRDLARFQFRATSEWMNGTHSRMTLRTSSGANQEHEHTE